MILEVVVLDITDGKTNDFEKAFLKAQNIISSANGYVSHELHKCIEKDNRYLLTVKWQSIQDHMEGFRESPQYQEWKALLHHFYSPFPTVEHYKIIQIF